MGTGGPGLLLLPSVPLVATPILPTPLPARWKGPALPGEGAMREM